MCNYESASKRERGAAFLYTVRTFPHTRPNSIWSQWVTFKTKTEKKTFLTSEQKQQQIQYWLELADAMTSFIDIA